MNKTYFKCDVTFLDTVTNKEEPKQVTQSYLVEAVNYTEAETKIHAQMREELAQQPFTVLNIAKFKLTALIDEQNEESFFLAKTSFLGSTNAGKEKKFTERTLINGKTLQVAIDKLEKKQLALGHSVNTRIEAIVQCPIVGIFA